MDDKKNKGLVDRGDGDFILNESGTSVKVDTVEGTGKERSDLPPDESEPYIPEVAEEQKDTTD